MHTRLSFDYAVLRIVPRVDRGEFINAGVVLHCPERAFLGVRIHLDEARLQALWPEAEIDLIRQHLQAFPRVSAGQSDGGPIAQLSRRQRFHWLVAPRSTMIQVSPMHSGLCEEPEAALESLFARLVLK